MLCEAPLATLFWPRGDDISKLCGFSACAALTVAMTLLRTCGSAADGVAIRWTSGFDAGCAVATVAAADKATATAYVLSFIVSLSIDRLPSRHRVSDKSRQRQQPLAQRLSQWPVTQYLPRPQYWNPFGEQYPSAVPKVPPGQHKFPGAAPRQQL